MASSISLYSSTIDVNYPVAGINQSSQGFRNNFGSIKSGLDQAATEVSNLQSKLIVITGDVTGTSAAFGTDNTAVSIALALPDLTTAGTIDSLANNVQATINTKGQVTSLTVTPISTNVDINTVYGVDVTAMGSGTGTANFPTFQFDQAGKVTSAGKQAVTFGLVGHPAARGSVVAGDIGNLTAITPVPAGFDGTYVLTATGNGATGLEWTKLNIPQGTVIGITQGPGIAVTPNSANPTVSMYIGSLPSDASIQDADFLPYHDYATDTSKRLNVSDFKTYISQSFLSTDLGSTPIYSSDAGGVVITSTGGITLNSLKWPTTIGTQGQVLTLSTGGNLVWAGSSNVAITKTIFVSDQYGDDTLGTGGMTTPYKTITKAMSTVASDGIVYTIAILSGTYTEDVAINPTNVIIKGLGGVSKPILKGVVTIGSGTSFVGLENLKLDRSDQPTTDSQPALYTTNDIASLQVIDCDFIRGSGAKAQCPIITLYGNLSTGAVFDGCAFQGQIEIDLVATGDVKTVISNVRQLGTREFGVTAGGNMRIHNVPVITGLVHNAGDLVVENVGTIIAKSMSVTLPNPPVYSWTGGAPDYSQPLGTLSPPVLLLDANGLPIQAVDGSSNPLYQSDGVTPVWQTTTGVQTVSNTTSTSTLSVGIYSPSTTGSLQLDDVGLYSDAIYAPIYKTGTAPYQFTNVERRADKDIIVGPRIAYELQIDSGNFMPRYEADFSGLRYADDHTTAVEGGKLDPNRAKVVHVTLVGSGSHLSLKTPVATSFNDGLVPASSELVTEFKVFVQQDSTGGRHVMWSSDSEPTIIWYSDYQLDDAPNAITIFTFYYHSVAQQWIGMRTSKAAERRRVFTGTGTTFVPTLQHANGFISLNNASGVGFQINGSVANFPVGTTFEIEQDGAGAVTVTGLGGQNVFVRTGSAATAGQYAVIKVTKKNTTDWVVSGDHA